jgi:general stress protein YciG
MERGYHADDYEDQGEAGKQGGHCSEGVVEDDQEIEMLFVGLGHD